MRLYSKRNYHFWKAYRSGNRDNYTWSSSKSEIELLQSLDLQRGDFSLTYTPTIIINENFGDLWLWKNTPNQLHLVEALLHATTNPEKAPNITFTNCLNYSLPGLNAADLPEAVPMNVLANLCAQKMKYTSSYDHLQTLPTHYSSQD